MKKSIYLAGLMSLTSFAATAGESNPPAAVVETYSEIKCVVLGEALGSVLTMLPDLERLVKHYASLKKTELESSDENRMNSSALYIGNQLGEVAQKMESAKAKKTILEKAIQEGMCDSVMVALGQRIQLARESMRQTKPMRDLLVQD